MATGTLRLRGTCAVPRPGSPLASGTGAATAPGTGATTAAGTGGTTAPASGTHRPPAPLPGGTASSDCTSFPDGTAPGGRR